MPIPEQRFGEGATATSVKQRARGQLKKGVSTSGNSLDEVLRWLDGVSEAHDKFVAKHGEEKLAGLREFSDVQTSALMAEMRQIQVNQYHQELVPGKMIIELRDLTVQMIDDVLGPAYASQLMHMGVPSELAYKAREDVLGGLRNLYMQYAQKNMSDA